MKKILTHLFVILSNFYIMSYVVGLFLMTATIFIGALNSAVGFIAILSILILCIIYQIIRDKFNFNSFGESLVSNEDKSRILTQTKEFTITRFPLFVLILLTLGVSGNILDGLSEGKIYSFGNIFMFVILTACSYYGMKNIVISSELIPVLLIISGLMLTGFAFKYSSKAELTGDFMFNMYSGLSVVWLIAGLIYSRNKIKLQVPSANA